ncbi:MAG: mannonate dehydratase [Anaerolineae bacterium]|nr:mannonate dehydratase [Anaerolineae bacterium]
MMRISVWNQDLSDRYLRQVTQLGADCIDFGGGDAFPGVREQGYPDLDGVLAIRKRIRSWGLDINRVTLPDITTRFVEGLPGGERDLENACTALRVFGEAGIPIARQRFAGDAMPGRTHPYRSVHRGGYLSRGERRAWSEPEPPTQGEVERWWERFLAAYGQLVPVAEEHNIKLAIHPSDTPYPSTPFGGLGFHRVIDAFPSRAVGYLYCIGTRAEAGGTPLILDEIHNYGRKGRIFTVHFRNVRGSLATSGGFEEVLLDDGDMNMFRVLRALDGIGFDGCLNPDHVPPLEGDGEHAGLGLAYSIGYIKALLAALAASD